MAANATQKDDMPSLLAMLKQKQDAPMGPSPASAGLSAAGLSAAAPSPTTPSDYTTMLAMGGAPTVPSITPEEKELQSGLLKQTQAQNAGLQSDVESQRQVARLRNLLLENRQKDISPLLQNLYNISGQNGSAAIAAAKPESVDDLTSKLQSAIKESAGAQDKLSDNELALLKMRLQFANTKGQVGAAQKQEKMYNDYYAKLAKDTNPSLASGRSGLGLGYKGLLAADKVQAVLDNSPNLNDITPQQVQDIYEGVANLVSAGGQSSEHRVNALIPANARKSAANLEQYITSIPQGAQQKEFLEGVQHLLDRERDVHSKNVRKSQYESFQGMAPIFAGNPQANIKFQALREARGFKPDMTYDPEASLTGYTKRTHEEGAPALSFEDFKKMKASGKIP